jgi:HPt (histidine-containing phosphotransfer) domain-containing protein
MVDQDALLGQFGGDTELLAEVIGVFLEDHVNQVAEIDRAIKAGDAIRLGRAAHALKGSVSNFGAESARSVAFELEQMAGGDDLASAGDALSRLLDELASLVTELEDIRSRAA